MNDILRDPLNVGDQVRAAIPAEGLFAEKEWRVATEPLALPADLIAEIEKIGYRLHRFLRACNDLYLGSARGRHPEWIANLLDQGKPERIRQFNQAPALRTHLPRMIRPDLIWTDDGLALTEIDSVPGGAGLTAWLNQTYARAGFQVVGGEHGMIDGFAGAFPDCDVVISEESATYRPEMNWLVGQLNERHGAGGGGGHWEVIDAAGFEPRGRNLYRFFELFDLPNLPRLEKALDAALAGELEINPPPKAFLEEKLWLALLQLRPLAGYWRRALRGKHWRELMEIVPRSWIVDPQPLPYHAVHPGLEIHQWEELADWSQKERNLVLKLSGFSEQAWGGRSVSIGQDLSRRDWEAALKNALHAFPHQPYVLQAFHKGRLLDIPFADPDQRQLGTLRGRVRLCPYFFVDHDTVQLGGILATICPADKKILHGMRDAVLAPVRAE